MDHALLPCSSDQLLQHATDTRTGEAQALSGCWKLTAGQAMTLQVRDAGELRIAHGRVWATFTTDTGSARARTGDHFLSRGESLVLQAGESMVMESFGAGHAASAYFSWEPVRQAEPVVSHVNAPEGFLPALADLRRAFGLAGHALGALARALAVGTGAGAESLLTRLAMVFVARRSSQPAVPADFDRFRQVRCGDCKVLSLSNLV